jgi:DNA-binding NarL/FixJ family response regulator
VSQSREEKSNPEHEFRILVAERDSMSSELLATTLVREKRFQASAIQSAELLKTLATHHVNLVVIAADLSYNERNGFDLARAASQLHTNVSIVILLNAPTHVGVIHAFRAGARGVFSREQPITELLDCIEHVRRGSIWAGRQETEFLLQVLFNLPAPSLPSESDEEVLTDRELQVVQWAAMGKTNKSIAQELRLSEHTVKNYMFRAFEKLGISSRVELLFYLTMKGHNFPAVTGGPVPADGEVKSA